MTAIDAFHMKQATFEMLHTGYWSRFADALTESLRGDGDGVVHSTGKSRFDMTGDEFTRLCRRGLDLGETFYVAPQMNALVTAAAEEWEPSETVEHADFPTDFGWLWVPGAITVVDVRGTLCYTSAVTWSRSGETVNLIFWTDKRNDSPWMKCQPHWESVPQLAPWHVVHLKFGEPLPESLEMGTMLPPEVAEKVHYVEHEGSTAVYLPEGWTAEQMKPRVRPERTTAWVVAALRIMQQPLAHIERPGLPANVRKGLQRRPHRVKQKAVTVIDFRRRESDFEPGSGREYSHRFLRRGHWRKQWIGSEMLGTRRQARIWIHPTVVGDPDKPLVLRNHVNALTR